MPPSREPKSTGGPRSVLFLAHSLNEGGAERQLVALAKGLHARGCAVAVALFYMKGVFLRDLQDAGIRVIDLRKQGRWHFASFLVRLVRLLWREQSSVVHGYMEGPNILSVLAKPICRRTRVVWGIRSSNTDFSQYDRFARASFRLAAWLSRFADLIIANSSAGADFHQRHGYSGKAMVVVHNGVDTRRFSPNRQAGTALRQEWSVAEGERLVGLVARFDPKKDHATFLRAAAILRRTMPNVKYVCVGGQGDADGVKLAALASELGVSHAVTYVAARPDMDRVHNAFDVACSSSAFGEGFSNAIGEAMACGVPCVVTDVGDSAYVVGDTGIVVSPRDPDALASAIGRLLSEPPNGRRDACRRRIETNFTTPRLVEKTESLLWPT